MKKLCIALIVLAFGFFSIWASPISARSVSIPSVKILATVQADGTVLIEEHRKVDFKGYYTEGYYALPKSGYAFMSDFSLSDELGTYAEDLSLDKKNRTYHRTETEDDINFDFYFEANDLQKTFVFRYQLHQIIELYDDFGQFYWQLQSDGWDIAVDQFEAEVRWESSIPVEDYRVWAYGPLWGEVLPVDDRHATVKVLQLPRNNFVEVRLLLPSSYFTMSQTHSGSLLEEILEQEVKNAEEANRQRDEAKKLLETLEETRKLRKSIGQSIMNTMNILALILLLLYLKLYLFHGRERKVPKQHIYYREPPSELRPALAGLLFNMNRWEDKFLQATILDLIRRKRIKYEILKNDKKTEDKKLSLLENNKDILADYEFILLFRMIFDVKRSINLKDLNKQFRESHDHFKKVFKEFKKSLSQEMEKYEYYDKKSNNQSLFALVIGVILTLAGPIVFSILSVFFMGQAVIDFYVLCPVGLLYWMGSKALQRRSMIGAHEYSKWSAFRSFLKDFSNLKSYAPQSLIIWERYLVYATAFGIAKVVLKALRVAVPHLIDKNKGTFLTSSLFDQDAIPNMRDLQNSIRSVSAISSSVHRVAGSSYSSGTGTGGGFSSGGGGGGGGSSGGFR